MPDEINNEETNAAASEWSGTPFQGWKDPEGEADASQEGKEQEQGVEAAPSEPEAIQPPQEVAAPPVDYSRTFRSLEEGDVVNGVVVHIDREGVLVDVGTKSEGIVRLNELSREAGVNPEDVVQVGDKIDVYVIQSEDQEGGLVLSKKRADFERAWEKVEDIHRTGKTLSAMVTDRVKGGLVVDLGIRGFVPASHVGSGKIKNLDRYVGQSIPLKVIEVDRERRKVVLSNRLAVEDERERQKGETLSNLAEGQIREGIVRRITDYGAFVDLGGIDGLLHISEMSWTRIKHPSEVVKVGDKIQVMVLKLNLDQGKVSLGLRQILPDPWAEVEHRYHAGDIIKGAVSRLVPFGAFVQVDGGIEGIIPNSELAVRRVSKPEDVVSVGQEVEVKVIDVRPEERRMTLSLRQLQQQKERDRDRAEVSSYTYGREEPRTTIGDLVGDMIREARAERRERKRKERQTAENYEDMHEEEVEPMFAPDEHVEIETVEAVAEPTEEVIETSLEAEETVDTEITEEDAETETVEIEISQEAIEVSEEAVVEAEAEKVPTAQIEESAPEFAEPETSAESEAKEE